MLPIESTDLGLHIAADFFGQNKILYALPGSALASVMDVTELPPGTSSNPKDVKLAVRITEANRLATAENGELVQTLQSLALDQVVKMGVEGVNNQLNYLRNVVKPFLTKVSNSVIADVNATPSRFRTSYEIIQVQRCPLFQIPAFNDLVVRFKTRSGASMPPSVPLGTVRFPSISRNEIEAVIKSAFSTSVAEQLFSKVGNWFKDSVDLEGIWARYFSDTVASGNKTTSDVIANASANELPVIYLLVIGLLNEPIEGIRASIDELESYLNSLAFVYSDVVDALSTSAAASRAEGRLVVGRSPDGRTISVDADVYDAWVSDEKLAGQPDALLGMLATRNQASLLAEIVEIQDQLVTAWNRINVMDARAHQDEQLTTMQKAILHYTETNLREQFDSLEKMVGDFGVALDKVRTKTRQLSTADLDDIPNVIMRILTDALFWRTDALMFFNNVMDISKKNPGLSYAEVEDLAVIDIVAVWLADQVKLLPDNHPAVKGMAFNPIYG